MSALILKSSSSKIHSSPTTPVHKVHSPINGVTSPSPPIQKRKEQNDIPTIDDLVEMIQLNEQVEQLAKTKKTSFSPFFQENPERHTSPLISAIPLAPKKGDRIEMKPKSKSSDLSLFSMYDLPPIKDMSDLYNLSVQVKLSRNRFLCRRLMFPFF
jgi:hypothetical protein